MTRSQKPMLGEESYNYQAIYTVSVKNQKQTQTIAAVILAIFLIATAFFAISFFIPVMAIPFAASIACTATTFVVSLVAAVILFKNCRPESLNYEERNELVRSIHNNNIEDEIDSMDP